MVATLIKLINLNTIVYQHQCFYSNNPSDLDDVNIT